MICRHCGYTFAFVPKEYPYLSDWDVARSIDNLSRKGHYYFTFDQLASSLIRFALKAKSPYRRLLARKKASSVSCLGWFLLFLVAAMWIGMALLKGRGGFLPALVVTVIAYVIYKSSSRGGKRKEEADSGMYSEKTDADANLSMDYGTVYITGKLKYYLASHPHSHFVDGKRMQYGQANGYQKEAGDYAPEKILIVEHNELVDMLVLNRFHFEHKTLVLGASRYPGFIFEYYKQCIEKFPGVPIYLAHDASVHGFHMKHALMADPEWRLQGKNVVDLGVNMNDIDKLNQPVLLPLKEASFSYKPSGEIGAAMPETFKENRVPLQSLGSKTMLGVFGLAVLAGLPLVSEELIHRRTEYTDAYVGGYG
jgi:hypothetical protein